MDPSQSSVPDQAAGNDDDSFSNHAVESEQMENDNVHINWLCVYLFISCKITS